MQQKYLSLPDKIKNIGFKKIPLHTCKGIEYITCNLLIGIKANGCYSIITIVGKKRKLVTKRIKKFEEELPSCVFFKPHKSHLINLLHVKEYSKKDNYIIMSDNSEVPLTKTKKNEYFKKMEILVI